MFNIYGNYQKEKKIVRIRLNHRKNKTKQVDNFFLFMNNMKKEKIN